LQVSPATAKGIRNPSDEEWALILNSI